VLLVPNVSLERPIDTRHPLDRCDVRDGKAALALGTRIAVARPRQNGPNPVMWQASQDYRAADAIHTARTEATRTRWGPERTGPER
jgi:hypothetical protein